MCLIVLDELPCDTNRAPRRTSTMGLRRLLGLSAFALLLLVPSSASALIPIPVGGHPKELDVFMRLTLERGLVEPNENLASFQKARWEMLTVGGGYTFGDLGPLQDFTVRADVTGYQSPAEVTEPERIKAGPYVDGDLIGQRTDEAYDRIFTAGFPERSDRIRMFRFAAMVLPYVQIADRFSLELSYLQKIFGYDTPATQLYSATARVVF